jgi:hypothetical protein
LPVASYQSWPVAKSRVWGMRTVFFWVVGDLISYDE